MAELLARHHAETERQLADIRNDAALDDRERARGITRAVAEANRRLLVLASASPDGGVDRHATSRGAGRAC